MAVLSFLCSLLLTHSFLVWAYFQTPLMHNALHTTLLIPFVLLYMAIAFPFSRFLQKWGLLKTGTVPPLPSTHLKGKVAIVTGATTGIGLAVARELLQLGATVVIHGRCPERGEAARRRLISEVATATAGAAQTEDTHTHTHAEKEREVASRLVFMKGDLADLEDVTLFCQNFLQRFNQRLDYLVLNAGMAGFHERRSTQGYDLVLAVNFLGHFAMARALLPYLEATAVRFYAEEEEHQPRVVCLSSTLHQWSRADPSYLLEHPEAALAEARAHAQHTGKNRKDTHWTTYLWQSITHHDSYPDSKLCQLLLSLEINRLAQTYTHARVRAIAVNPGAVTSDIWRFFGPALRKKYVDPVLSHTFISCPQAAVPVMQAVVGEAFPRTHTHTETQKLDNVHYLTPYFVPFGGRFFPFKGLCLCVFDLFSPFYGVMRASPRLPFGGGEEKARKLWFVSSRIVHPFLEKRGLLQAAVAWPVCVGVGMNLGENVDVGVGVSVREKVGLPMPVPLGVNAREWSTISMEEERRSVVGGEGKGEEGEGEGEGGEMLPSTPEHGYHKGVVQRRLRLSPLKAELSAP